MSDDETTVDYLTLTFNGTNNSGATLHELRAAHVAEVLQGLVGLTSDFAKAGVFHDEGPAQSEILVRPPKEGSFLIEVLRVYTENAEVVKTTGAYGVPTIGTILWWATKSMRAEVKDVTYLDNGNVKLAWQDNTVDEVPAAAWKELQTRKRRRKKQLRQIMAPLSDHHVTDSPLHHRRRRTQSRHPTSLPRRLASDAPTTTQSDQKTRQPKRSKSLTPTAKCLQSTSTIRLAGE